MSYAPNDPSTAAGLLAALPAGLKGAASVQALRDAGRALFAATGLPTSKSESWRATSLKALVKLTLTADAPDLGVVDALPAVKLSEGRTRARVVLVNGRFRADLSDLTALTEGEVVLKGLAQCLNESPDEVSRAVVALSGGANEPLTALNMAGLDDGAFLAIEPNANVKPLIEIIHVAVGGEGAAPLSQPRLVITAGENARATVVEHHVGVGAGPYVLNMVTEIALGAGARLNHYVDQRAGAQAHHLSRGFVDVAEGAVYDAFALNLGGKLARHEVTVRLSGEGAACTLDGAYIASGRQHTDTTTRIEHIVPGATSREVYKGVIDDDAQAVFQGKIVVKPGAVKTDGHQLNRALLLSERAGVDAKPELEIYADDVKCSHGCSVGELDDAALFFLRARGIPKDEARALLIAAFLQEAVDTIADEDVRAAFAALIDSRLNCPGVSEALHAPGN